MDMLLAKNVVCFNDFRSAICCRIDGTEVINDVYRSRLVWVVEGLESEEIDNRKKKCFFSG